MTSSIDKSLIEVWEMKEKAWKDFKDSEYTNYIDYLNNSLKDIKKKYNFGNNKVEEKEKQSTSA